MSIEKTTYMGFADCLKLSNGTVDVIVSTQVGPRILFYGFSGGTNVLGEHPESAVETALGKWKPYGGHRLWAWPELFPATYAPDNDPVEVKTEGEFSLTLQQRTDGAGIEKEIQVTLSSVGTEVKLGHRITSRNLWPIQIAPWAITVVAGGTAIIPRVPFRSHDESVAAAQPLMLTAFTNLQDPRFSVGSKYILLTADAEFPSSQKFGLRNKEGWCAHLVDDCLFVKRFSHDEGAVYPDYGVNNEVYVEGAFMEVELLGPVQVLAPGTSAVSEETWNLFGRLGLGGSRDEGALSSSIEPLLRTLR